MGSTSPVTARTNNNTHGLRSIDWEEAMECRSEMQEKQYHQIDGVEFVFGTHPLRGPLIIITGSMANNPALVVSPEIFAKAA